MLIAQTILNGLQIAAPCSADWASMEGDGRCRTCALCDKQVYDISTLGADEALALIREKEGRLCLRLWRRADGTVLTADCPVGRRARARRRLWAPVGAASLLAMAALNQACARPKVEPQPVTEAALTALPKSVCVVTMGTPGVVGRDLVDMTNVAQSRTMSEEDWSHLPLR
jgi:hypothetical protein